MSSEADHQEIIDRYLRGELDQEAKLAFEDQMASDPVLRQEVEEQKQLLDLMVSYKKVSHFRSQLNRFHKEIDVTQIRREIYEPFIPKKRNNILRYTSIIAAAATIAIATTFGLLYFMGWFNYDKQFENYYELKKDIDKISSDQKSIWSAFLKSQEKKMTRYSGTCFTISNNGYMITNNHLVKDVDTVFISNKTDSVITYKASVVYKDNQHDLAILKISDTCFTDFNSIPLSFNESLSDLGDYVYTLGYSKSDIVFGEGSISSLTGYNGDSTSYQVSIPANPGNSGGPLINSRGNLIGVVSGKHSKKVSATFAVKADYITAIIDSISQDTLLEPPIILIENSSKRISRTEQIKKLRPYIFKVEVYQ